MNALEQARKLIPPPVVDTEAGEAEGADFWAAHRDTIRAAWREWEQARMANSTTEAWPTVSQVVDKSLYDAISTTWKTRDFAVSEETLIRPLWETVAPDVYSAQLLDPDQIYRIRQHLDAAEQSSAIPRRRPNGMNRYGLVLYPDDVDGAVRLEGWDTFFNDLVDTVIRPVARMLFPLSIGPGDDDEYYAFTIRYSASGDVELKEHADASTVTLNLNLNLPHELPLTGLDDTDDDVYFKADTAANSSQHQYHNVTMRPGRAVIHKGQTRHGAYPTDGRMQLVVWFMGRHGYVRVAPYDQPTTPFQRWSKTMVLERNDGRYHGISDEWMEESSNMPDWNDDEL